jgi:hypothetical protein
LRVDGYRIVGFPWSLKAPIQGTRLTVGLNARRSIFKNFTTVDKSHVLFLLGLVEGYYIGWVENQVQYLPSTWFEPPNFRVLRTNLRFNIH